MAERISPIQMIKQDKQIVEREADQTTANLSGSFHFWMPSNDLLLLMVAGHSLYLVASFLLRWSIKRSGTPSRSNLKILSFVYLLFAFFTEEFFGNCLNTEQVTVNTDDLLFSKNQILNTNKEFCFFEKGVEFDFMKKVNSLFRLL